MEYASTKKIPCMIVEQGISLTMCRLWTMNEFMKPKYTVSTTQDTYMLSYLNRNTNYKLQIETDTLFYENCCDLIEIATTNFVHGGLIGNKRALVQIMAWYQGGDKPLSEPTMARFTEAYMLHSTSVSWILFFPILITN